MADIEVRIEYDGLRRDFLEKKLLDPDFKGGNWGDADLEEFRSEVRGFYRRAQRAKCAYCKNELSVSSPLNCHIEHLLPKSKYCKFIFTPENLCVICADCNVYKRGQEVLVDDPQLLKNEDAKIYPRSSGAFLIFHPHFDNYEDHILKLKGGFYVDKTRKGNFTIGLCGLNRRLEKFGWDMPIFSDNELIAIMNDYVNDKDCVKRSNLLSELREMLAVSV